MAVLQSLAQRVSTLLHPAHADEVPQELAANCKLYYALLVIEFFVILVPIWMVNYPGMVDYPNHLTRCYILAHYHDNPIWQQRYLLVHDPIPNLAIDLIIPLLLRFFPLLVCGKLFLSLEAALYVVGCSEVGRAVSGKPNWLALICAFTFYNSDLLYGFVNYIFGVGVFLCVFAYWLRIRNAMTPPRFLLCCLLSISAYLAHLSSIVFLCVACLTIALIDFAHNRQFRGLIGKLAWLASPGLLMAGFMKSSGQIGIIEWPSLIGKLISLLAPVRSYSVPMDAGVIFVLLACAIIVFRESNIHATAAVGFVFLALFLITPKVLFTSSAADARYVIPSCLLLILSIKPHWGRWQSAALALALATMAIRMGSITANWMTISRRSEQVLAMGDDLPQRSRIYVFKNELDVPKLDRGFSHVIEFWTVTKNADLSTFFALPGQQPLVFRQIPCTAAMGAKCLVSYDYIWTDDPPASLLQIVLQVATPAAVWEKVTLWRVNRVPAS
jgi:hypothetical protein